MKRALLFLLFLLVSPGWAQSGDTLLVNGTIHTALEPAFEGYLLIKGDSIAQVGRGSAPDLGVPVFDMQGGHLYPGLIDADSAMGLVEFESLRATRDEQEVGDLNPNLIARQGFRAESDTVSVARSQGVLYSGVNPRGTSIAGQGSVMRTWGWTWEDMTLVPAWAMAVNWPALTVSPETEGEKRSKRLQEIGESLFGISEAFQVAKSYRPGQTKDVKWGALTPYARGEKPVMIRVDGEEQIRSALEWTQKAGLRPVLVAGRDIHLFARQLAERQIPVIYWGVFNQNPRPWESYDLHYRTPTILIQAGVVLALSPNGLAFDVRELRDLGGKARAFGLSEVQALQSVTLNPARILGVDGSVGSLEVGKKATLVLCDGDLLEVAPVVRAAWGEGRPLDLDDRQKQLDRKYRERWQSR